MALKPHPTEWPSILQIGFEKIDIRLASVDSELLHKPSFLALSQKRVTQIWYPPAKQITLALALALALALSQKRVTQIWYPNSPFWARVICLAGGYRFWVTRFWDRARAGARATARVKSALPTI